MGDFSRLAPSNLHPSRPLSPRLNRRLEQIRQAYNYVYSLVQTGRLNKTPYFIRLAFDEHYDAWAVLVKNSLSLLDKNNRRFLFGVNFEFGASRQLGKDIPRELCTENADKAFDWASKTIIGELKRRFPALGIADATKEFPFIAPSNPRRNVHGHGFYLVIAVPLGSIPATVQEPPPRRLVVSEPPIDLTVLLKKRH